MSSRDRTLAAVWEDHAHPCQIRVFLHDVQMYAASVPRFSIVNVRGVVQFDRVSY